MRVVLKSYAVKNASAPGTKAKKLKANKNFNVSRKTLGGVKDNRKFVNDKSLSEAEKIARRMDLENIKNKVKSHKINKEDSIFSNIKDDTDWFSDPMMMKVKQLGRLDEGLDESSGDEESAEGDASKYFADGRSEKPKKKTLDDMIRESKIKKAEKKSVNEESSTTTKNVNLQFNKSIRHILPQICAQLKAMKGDIKKTPEPDKLGDEFDEAFNMLIMAEGPKNRVLQSNVKEISQKEKDKLAKTKLGKLQERLKMAGKISENNEELHESDLESDESEDNDKVQSQDEEQSEDDDQSEDEEQTEDEELSDSGDQSEDEELSDNEDQSEDEEQSRDKTEKYPLASLVEKESDSNSKNIIEKLKSCITSSKVGKRKLPQEADVSPKKAKLESNKSEIDCLRVLSQMDAMKADVMLFLASKMDCVDMSAKSVTKKLVLATVFQDVLETNGPYSYSPELVRCLRVILRESSRDSWLKVDEDLSAMKKEELLAMVGDCEESARLAVSAIYHTARLLQLVVRCNKSLPNKRSLFGPLKTIISDLPTSFYPSWLVEEIRLVRELVAAGVAEPVPIMRQKRTFKIVELLEPDVEDKFASKKNVTKTLQKKVKNEMKALRKDIRLDTKDRVMREVAEGRKNAEMRTKKTLAIINGMHQMD